MVGCESAWIESKKSWIFCDAPEGAEGGAVEVEEVGAAVKAEADGFVSLFGSDLLATEQSGEIRLAK